MWSAWKNTTGLLRDKSEATISVVLSRIDSYLISPIRSGPAISILMMMRNLRHSFQVHWPPPHKSGPLSSLTLNGGWDSRYAPTKATSFVFSTLANYRSFATRRHPNAGGQDTERLAVPKYRRTQTDQRLFCGFRKNDLTPMGSVAFVCGSRSFRPCSMKPRVSLVEGGSFFTAIDRLWRTPSS